MSKSFRALGVSAKVEQELASRGIAEAFPIQELALPDALAGHDVLAKSPTGSGKTLAFGLPIVERVSPNAAAPAALVLVPTPDPALQVTDELPRIEAALPHSDGDAVVDHSFVSVTAADKLDRLLELLDAERGLALVFVRTKRGADRLAKKLKDRDVAAAALHGDMTQGARERALDRF